MMKKYYINWKKLISLSLGAAFSSAPLAVAISCGGSSAEIVEEMVNTPISAELTKLEANLATSNSKKIEWLNLPPVVAPAESYLYTISEDETTADFMSSLSFYTWSATPPTEMEDYIKRPNLWVQVVPKAGVTLPPREQYIKITESSKLRNVKVLINVNNIDSSTLSNRIELIGQSDSPGFSYSNLFTFESQIKLQFSFKNGPYQEENDFLNYLKSPEIASTLTLQDFNQISGRIVPRDSERYVLSQELTFAVRSKVVFADAQLSSALKAALQNIKVSNLDTGSYLDIKWSGWEEVSQLLPDDKIASISYHIGQFENKESIQTLTNDSWTTSATLPNQVHYLKRFQNFWIRLTPQSGVTLTEKYFNLTFSSQIKNVRTLIVTDTVDMNILMPRIFDYFTNSPKRKTFDFYLNDFVSANQPGSSPIDVVILYRRTPRSEWKTSREIRDELAKIPGPTPVNYFNNAQVKLAPIYISDVLTSDRQQAMNMDGVNLALKIDNFIKNELPKITVDVNSSIPSALVWNEYSLTAEPAIKKIGTALLTAENLTSQATNNAVTDFRLNLPTSADEMPDKRFFYVYIVLDSLPFPIIVDLTESSHIRQVVSLPAAK